MTTQFTVAEASTELAARDRALAQFLSQRLAEVEMHGCGAEWKALAGTRDVLTEFQDKYSRVAQMADYDFFVAQIDTMRWVLCCTATRAFSSHPEFSPAYRPADPDTSPHGRPGPRSSSRHENSEEGGQK